MRLYSVEVHAYQEAGSLTDAETVRGMGDGGVAG
jgi:hypothetical protein